MPYHAGELEVQARAGVQIMAQRVGRGIHAAMPPIARTFLRDQTFAVAASVAPDGSVWASLLTGQPGFIEPLDERTLHIDDLPAPGDPLLENLAGGSQVGLVVIDFAQRQRVRINGMGRLKEKGLILAVREAYSNCPKYIQARAAYPISRDSHAGAASHSAEGLTPDQMRQIGAADTFFIASHHPDSGADASHRGGNPGFVEVSDSHTLVIPDYTGNMMFNTLGNIVANPRIGLLFPDFERGSTLQLTGSAFIDWDADAVAGVPGAQRLIRFHIDQVIETTGAIPSRYEFLQASPFNPPLSASDSA